MISDREVCWSRLSLWQPRETPPLTMIDLTIFFRQKLKRDLNSSLKRLMLRKRICFKRRISTNAEGPEKHRGPARRKVTWVLSAHKGHREKAMMIRKRWCWSLLWPCLPTFQIVGGSGPRIIFSSFRNNLDMIEELGSSYMGNGTSTVIRGRGNV